MKRKKLANFGALLFLLFGSVISPMSVIAENETLMSSESAAVSEGDTTSESEEEHQTSDTSVSELPSNLEKPAVSDKQVSAPVQRAEAGVIVTSWDEFVAATADTTNTNITVAGNLIATEDAVIEHDVRIDFANTNVSLGKHTIRVFSTARVTAKDVSFSGEKSTSLFTGDGSVSLSGNVISSADNGSAIAVMNGGTFEFREAVVAYTNTSGKPAITSKNLTITERSQVTTTDVPFFVTEDPDDDASHPLSFRNLDGNIEISKGSVVQNSYRSNNSDSNSIWEIRQRVNFLITGKGTQLMLDGKASSEVNEPIFTLKDLKHAGAQLTIADEAILGITSKKMGAISLTNDNVELTIKERSQLKVELTDDSTSAISAPHGIRFMNSKDSVLNIESNSRLSVDKKGGRGSGIRMYGGGNTINVKGASDFIIHNTGTGEPMDAGATSRYSNFGVQFSSSDPSTSQPDTFNVEGENSNVEVIAENGPAFSGTGNEFKVNAGSGTYFIARGRTETADGAIFNSSNALQFFMDRVKYFDFSNTRAGGGKLFTGDANSKFASNDSNVSVWRLGTDQISGDPTFSWPRVSYQLSGANLDVNEGFSDADMSTNFGKMSEYTRMSGNNQAAVVDLLRTPTNADKTISGHVLVPEGKYEEPRNAFTDEVTVRLGLYDDNDRVISDNLTGITEKTSVYGDKPKLGTFVINTPDNEFLKEGYTIKVLAAWLGKGAETSNTVIKSNPAVDFLEPEKTVVDVTPPVPAVLTMSSVAAGTNKASGIGEPDALVSVALNGKIDPDITAVVGKDGHFSVELPADRRIGDTVQILLRDTAGDATAAGVKDAPVTNNSIGNINPFTDLSYHDAVFQAGSAIRIAGALTLLEAPTAIDFGTNQIHLFTQTLRAKDVHGRLIVADERGAEKAPWKLTLKQSEPLSIADSDISDTVHYVKTGAEKVSINANETIVEERTHAEDGEIDISQEWTDEKRGLQLEVPSAKQQRGEYSGTLTWTLSDVP